MRNRFLSLVDNNIVTKRVYSIWTLTYLLNYFLQHKTAMIDILIAHHLSIVADLEQEGAEQTRRDCFKYIDEAIDIFMRVNFTETSQPLQPRVN